MGLRRLSGIELPLFACVLSCVDPAPLQLEIVDPCNQAALRDAERITVVARELDTGETWTATLDADSGSGELPEIPVGAKVEFDVELSKEGEVYAWAIAKPFDMTVDNPIVPQVQPSRIGAFTKPHAPGEPGLCAGYQSPRAGAKLLPLVNGDILHLGGYELSDGTSSYNRGIERWSSRDNSLEEVANLNFPRVDDVATRLGDGTWILTGGRFEATQAATGASETSHFALALHISPAGEVDDTPGVLEAGRSGHVALGLSDGRVWLLGGRGQAGALTQTEIYNPSTKLSEPGPTLSVGRWNAGLVTLPDDTALLIGGENDSGVLDTIEVVKLGDASGSISPLTLSEARTRPAVVQHDDTFWVLGGGTLAGDDFNRGQGSAAIDGFERGGSGFQRLCGDTGLSLAKGRFLGTLLSDQNQAYLAGGYDENGVLLKELVSVSFADLRNCTPEQGQEVVELGQARAFMGATILDSGLMVFGGGQSRDNGAASSSSLVEIYRSAR